MKNTKFFPFERNKYFYGKLLSVEDFELEQNYINNKRRMLNRYLDGFGIVAGLYVVSVDEQTISVETGVALDCAGREIVVDTPVIKKLSMIDGFDACTSSENKLYAYLCLEYREEEIDRVHNVTKSISAGRETENADYNKIKETYRIFLTDREPEIENPSPSDLYEEVKTIYWKNDIRIRQVMPRYVQAGHQAELRIQVENLGRKTVSFSYDLVLTCLMHENQHKVRVTFDEMMVERTGRYELIYKLDTSDSINVEGTAVIDPESTKLSLSGNQLEDTWEGKQSVHIGKDDKKSEMVQSYYKTAMEHVVKAGYQQPIYLAQIFMVAAGDAYIIDKIVNVPFGQYVKSNYLDTALNQMIMKDMEKLSSGLGDSRYSLRKGKKENALGISMSQGKSVVYLGKGAQRGEKFYSDEILHGLGLGVATIILGVEKNVDQQITYGSSEIFEREGVGAEVAAKLDPNQGSFVIGVRLLAPTKEEHLKVHWTAIRDMRDLIMEKSDRRIFITPNVLELHIREPYYLEAVCENMVEKAVKWSVKEEGDGTIDAKGLYTAPNMPGVYEVVAQSVAFPEVKASIFVVVREYE